MLQYRYDVLGSWLNSSFAVVLQGAHPVLARGVSLSLYDVNVVEVCSYLCLSFLGQQHAHLLVCGDKILHLDVRWQTGDVRYPAALVVRAK